MSIKLYELCSADPKHVFSPHCWKTRLSLAHKGLDFDSVPKTFVEVSSIEEGDGRRVPVIRDGEKVIEESYEIAKYLDEAYPDTPKLLADDGSKDLADFIIAWATTQLHPEVAKLCVYDIYNALAEEDQAFFRKTREKLFGMTLEQFDEKFAKTPDALVKNFAPLEMLLGKKKFLGGDEPTFADYVAFAPLQWLRTTTSNDVMPKDSKVAEWFDRLLDMYDGMGRKAKCGKTA